MRRLAVANLPYPRVDLAKDQHVPPLPDYPKHKQDVSVEEACWRYRAEAAGNIICQKLELDAHVQKVFDGLRDTITGLSGSGQSKQ
jgi:hypothetical protein